LDGQVKSRHLFMTKLNGPVGPDWPQPIANLNVDRIETMQRDKLGRVISQTSADGARVEQQHDSRGRVIRVEQFGNTDCAWATGPASRVTEIEYGVLETIATEQGVKRTRTTVNALGATVGVEEQEYYVMPQWGGDPITGFATRRRIENEVDALGRTTGTRVF